MPLFQYVTAEAVIVTVDAVDKSDAQIRIANIIKDYGLTLNGDWLSGEGGGGDGVGGGGDKRAER